VKTKGTRVLLPAPRDFYEAELGELRRSSLSWYRPKAGCPFHPSKSKTSFSVNLDSGGGCFSCGAHGGDLIAFVRLRYNLNFVEACKRLGCWEENGKHPKQRPGPRVPFLVMTFSIDGQEYRAKIPDQPKTDRQLTRSFYYRARDRLTELRQGAPEQCPNEEEIQWGILSLSWELIRIDERSTDMFCASTSS